MTSPTERADPSLNEQIDNILSDLPHAWQTPAWQGFTAQEYADWYAGEAIKAALAARSAAPADVKPVHLSGEFPWSREDAEAAMTIAVAAVNQQHEKATAAMRAEIERLKYALQQHDQVADEKTDAAHRSFVRAEKAEAQIEKLRGLLQRARNQYSKPWPPEFDKAVDAALSNNPEQS